MTATLHTNSRAAYHATGETRANLESKILGLMADGRARTDRQICAELGLTEPCRPRVTELVDDGLIHEVGSVKCEYTGKKVRLTRRFL